MFSDEESVVNLIENPLFIMSYFSFIFSLPFDSLIMMYLKADHFKFIVLGVHEFGWLARF